MVPATPRTLPGASALADEVSGTFNAHINPVQRDMFCGATVGYNAGSWREAMPMMVE